MITKTSRSARAVLAATAIVAAVAAGSVWARDRGPSAGAAPEGVRIDTNTLLSHADIAALPVLHFADPF